MTEKKTTSFSNEDFFVLEEQTLYKRVNLENRLIDFALGVRDLIKVLSHDEFTSNLKDQISRSSTSVALNYGEAQGAESRRDFIHKIQICLKELRETMVGLKFVVRGNYNVPAELINNLTKENNELISIFMKRIETARKNLDRKGK